jgi:hypothetical protein
MSIPNESLMLKPHVETDNAVLSAFSCTVFQSAKGVLSAQGFAFAFGS